MGVVHREDDKHDASMAPVVEDAKPTPVRKGVPIASQGGSRTKHIMEMKVSNHKGGLDQFQAALETVQNKKGDLALYAAVTNHIRTFPSFKIQSVRDTLEIGLDTTLSLTQKQYRMA
jgi:hypothetical protein